MKYVSIDCVREILLIESWDSSVTIIQENFFHRIKVSDEKNCSFCSYEWSLDGAIRLHREVVLITDDRNLRLKAQARNVPVKDLMKFLELTQVVL